jgi:hypothetical protein
VEQSGEVQNILNQKNDSKSFRTVDFASRFVLLIKSKLKFIFSIIIMNFDAKSTVLKDF